MGPSCKRALLFDPGGVAASGQCDAATIAFRQVKNVGHHHHLYFGAQSHGPLTRCLRFARCIATPRARLASGWRPPLAELD